MHGDLKPENVLLAGARADRRGFTCKLGDFGLSRLLGDEQTHVDTGNYGTIRCLRPRRARGVLFGGVQGAAVPHLMALCRCSLRLLQGIPACAAAGSRATRACRRCPLPALSLHTLRHNSHAAPERINDGVLSRASDLWALGLVVWAVLHGQAPFQHMPPLQVGGPTAGGKPGKPGRPLLRGCPQLYRSAAPGAASGAHPCLTLPTHAALPRLRSCLLSCKRATGLPSPTGARRSWRS